MTGDHTESSRLGGLTAYFARHPTAATILMAVMLILGLVSGTQIRSQFFPDVVIDTITVTVDWDGAGPEAVDASIVAVIEPALKSIEGVSGTTSVSSEGRATVTLTFDPGWDMARAGDDVTAALESVRTLPEDADPPEVSRGTWRDKVTEIVVSGPIALEQLGQIGDDLVARLYRQGITRVALTGISAPQIEVTVAEEARIRHDLSLREVATAIATQAAARPAGDLADGAARLRAGEEQHDVNAIRDMVVRVNDDGSRLLVRNTATVAMTGADAGRAYFLGEDPAVLIRVDRSPDGDAIEIQQAVEDLVAALRPGLPDGVDMRLINPRAEEISDRLTIVYENAVQGLVLVLLTLFVFLNARVAFWVAMGIPVAMLAGVAVMWVAGISMNMMSLFALIIMLGIVVDDAIVVAEHTDYRARDLGEGPDTAPVRAVQRMMGPVSSSTATTVLAFLALLFVGGSFGTLIADIPVVVAAVLLASLVETFLILPNHMRHSLRAGLQPRWYDRPSALFNRGFAGFTDRIFAPFMRWVIRLRHAVVAGMVLLLALSAAAVIRGDVPWIFYTAPESGSIAGNFAFLPGHTRDDTRAMTRELDRAVAAVAARHAETLGVNPVVHTLVQLGGTAGRGFPGQETMDPDLLGSIDIGLIGADQRPFSAAEFVREVQQELRLPPGLALLTFRSQGAGPAEDSLAVNFFGTDSAVLKAAATELIAALGQFPEVTGLEDNLAYGKEDIVLRLTPQAQALGLTEAGIGAELFARLRGITAVEFPDGTRTSSIVVRLPEDEQRAAFLDTTRIRIGPGAFVPLGELVTVESRLAFSTVTRDNGRTVVSVTGSLSEDDPERASAIAAALRSEIVPTIAARHNLDWELGGLALQEDSFLNEALFGFLLCVLGIYLVLAWTLRSWVNPLIVLAAIPFGLIGTVWGHASFDLAMSLFTVIGLVGMSGIIINDAIVLVSTVDDYARKMDYAAAVVEGVKNRLRPILLTTLTTVLGLAPLMYEDSRLALFLKPTVVTLVFGLSVGFFVVLLMVPALMVIREDIAASWRSLRRVLGGQRMPAGARRIAAGALLALIAVNALVLGPWSLGLDRFDALAALALPDTLGSHVAVALVLTLVIVAIAGALLLGRRRAAPSR
ncbi:MAG: efflux RND transporter permease subunit [Rhodobacter sp.]|nr:efflux RND transporter permease subunit [Paracoccaceae bacterium]MCC0075126.1 efflux RND transporter permease subunit [Rhodobacter sp.]